MIDEINYTVRVNEWGTFWRLDGKRHRVGGPAVEWWNGAKWWYRNGKLHREDGPAVEWHNGDRDWYRNGKLHRVDGPAMECANGDKHWFLNDKKVTEKEHKRLRRTDYADA